MNNISIEKLYYLIKEGFEINAIHIIYIKGVGIMNIEKPIVAHKRL